MAQEIDPQQFGELKATVAQLVASVGKLDQNVEHLLSQIDQASGGWKVLIAVASAGAAAATAFAWVLQHIQLRP